MDCPKRITVKSKTIFEEENAKTNDFQHQEVSLSSRGTRSSQSSQGQSLSREELQALVQPTLELLSGHLSANQC